MISQIKRNDSHLKGDSTNRKYKRDCQWILVCFGFAIKPSLGLKLALILLLPAPEYSVYNKARNLVQWRNALSIKLDSIPIRVRNKKTQQSSTNIEILFELYWVFTAHCMFITTQLRSLDFWPHHVTYTHSSSERTRTSEPEAQSLSKAMQSVHWWDSPSKQSHKVDRYSLPECPQSPWKQSEVQWKLVIKKPLVTGSNI